MAVSTGLSVANNYYAQPLLPAIGRNLHMAAGTTGLIVTAAQVGYAAGLVFLLPLGDLAERRRLVTVMAVGTGLALFVLAAAPSATVLLAAAFVVGSLSVVTQVLVAFAASLASDDERGSVVGSVMSGLLLGVLLARTVAGLLAETGTWRVVYVVAGAAMLVEAAILRRVLPEWRTDRPSTYPRVVASVFELVREESVLRLRSLYGLMSFGAFSVLWTSIALLLASHYHYSSGVIGLFGLAGAAGAVAATAAGRFSDRRSARTATGVTSVLLLASWPAIWFGRSDLIALVIGVVALDIAVQGLHITNQGEIYRLRPEARSRLTAAYMFFYFVGGSVGSLAATTVYDAVGWGGVSAVGAAFATGAVGLWLVTLVRSPPLRSGSACSPSPSTPS